ncbi:MAG: hypothetical protein Q9207_003134 [Kuettlingeria erythrocarpa]
MALVIESHNSSGSAHPVPLIDGVPTSLPFVLQYIDRRQTSTRDHVHLLKLASAG